MIAVAVRGVWVAAWTTLSYLLWVDAVSHDIGWLGLMVWGANFPWSSILGIVPYLGFSLFPVLSEYPGNWIWGLMAIVPAALAQSATIAGVYWLTHRARRRHIIAPVCVTSTPGSSSS